MTETMPEFTYSYFEYENGVLGKCNEMPAVSAQGKNRDEVCSLLRNMTRDYLEVVREVKNKR
jgi:hypothetical protein